MSDAERPKTKSRRPLWLTAAALLLTGGAGTGVSGAFSGSDAKTQAAATSQKLSDHIAVEREARDDAKKRLDALERGRVRDGRKLDRLELLIELELDQHKVPKAKRPPREEEEP